MDRQRDLLASLELRHLSFFCTSGYVKTMGGLGVFGAVTSILILYTHGHGSVEFEAREILLLKYTSTSLTLAWSVGLDRSTHYQVWYWPANTTLKVQMLTTTSHNITVQHLIPGELYNVWLLGIDGNVTTDYVTLQHRTGIHWKCTI